MFHGKGEQGYLEMLRTILETGEDRSDRTGVGTREIFGATLEFDLSNETFPLLTTRRLSWKTSAREMFWMLSGSPNIRPLLEQNVHIWTEWPHQRYVRESGENIDLDEFERRILADEEFAEFWGDTGRAYGTQWRDWAIYEPNGVGGYMRSSFDQFSAMLDQIETNPNSRRLMFTAWNPAELDGMMLPPCLHTYQLNISPSTNEHGQRYVSMSCAMRSVDSLLGAPFNIAGGALILRLIALHYNLAPRSLIMMLGNTHIYKNHFAQVKELLTREPRLFPTLKIRKAENIFEQTVDDLEVIGYDPHPAIKAPIAV